jgi:hypothetical protein
MGPELRVNDDQTVLGLRFDQFRIGEAYYPDDLPNNQDYYTRYDIFLGDHVVGRWQTRHKFYPFAYLKVWFVVEDGAEEIIRAFIHVGRSRQTSKVIGFQVLQRTALGLSWHSCFTMTMRCDDTTS